MSIPLHAPVSDRRPTVTQPETNADQSKGFVQTPHPAAFRDLSDGAYRQYQWLLSYAWNGERCWPSERTLAEAQNVTDRTVRTRMRELKAKGYVTSESRGPGRGNVYNLQKTVSSGEEACFRRGRKESSAPLEVDAVDVHAVKNNQPPPPPPALPPTTERKATAAGGASRLRSTTDGKRQPLTDEQQAVNDFLVNEKVGMWSTRAERIARSGVTLEAARIAWAEVASSDRTQKQHALAVRLAENAEGYEREANNRMANEALKRASEADPVLYALLCPRDLPLSLEPIPECRDWFLERVLGPAKEAVGRRKGWIISVDIMARAFVDDLRNGKAPLAAVAHTRDALSACYSPALSPLIAKFDMPQAAE